MCKVTRADGQTCAEYVTVKGIVGRIPASDHRLFLCSDCKALFKPDVDRIGWFIPKPTVDPDDWASELEARKAQRRVADV